MRRTQHFSAIVLTALVVAIVMMSGPANAITLGFTGLESSAQERTDVEFQALIDLHANDLLMDQANITLTISDGNSATYMCIFDIQGTEISCSDRIHVTLSENNLGAHSQGYAYLYGYGYFAGTTATNGTNYSAMQVTGYGYSDGAGENSYSTLVGSGPELIYDVTFESPNVIADTDFTITLKVDVTDGTTDGQYRTLSDNQGTVTITNRGGGGGGGSGGSSGNGNIFTVPPGQTDNPRAHAMEVLSRVLAKLQEKHALREIVKGKTMPFGGEYSFRFAQGLLQGERHTVRLDDINEDSTGKYVRLIISSEPQEVDIYQSQSTLVDVDGDGGFDLLITADDIREQEADLSMSEIDSAIGLQLGAGEDIETIYGQDQATDTTGDETITGGAVTNPPAQSGPAETPKGFPGWLTALIIIIAAGIAVVLIVRRKKH